MNSFNRTSSCQHDNDPESFTPGAGGGVEIVASNESTLSAPAESADADAEAGSGGLWLQNIFGGGVELSMFMGNNGSEEDERSSTSTGETTSLFGIPPCTIRNKKKLFLCVFTATLLFAAAIGIGASQVKNNRTISAAAAANAKTPKAISKAPKVTKAPKTAVPSMMPSDSPSTYPSQLPSSSPSLKPSSSPSISVKPSSSPSLSPSKKPSASPSLKPSSSPTVSPSLKPSASPSLKPSSSPTVSPSKKPSASPSLKPSSSPTVSPSKKPSASPSLKPSSSPTVSPSLKPSASPSLKPSSNPSVSPSEKPTSAPSLKPSSSPSLSPSKKPTSAPTAPTSVPTSSTPLSQGKSGFMDSDHSSGLYPASNALDGDEDSFAHTESSTPGPHFLEVDLGALYIITSITVVNREYGANRFYDATFTFYDENNYLVFTLPTTGQIGQRKSWTIDPPIQAWHARVTIPGQILNIAEFQIYGSDVPVGGPL